MILIYYYTYQGGGPDPEATPLVAPLFCDDVLKTLNVLICFGTYYLLNHIKYEIHSLLGLHNSGRMVFEHPRV
jgi:hypothetical protein